MGSATPPVRTLLRGGADDHVRVFLNGKLALESDDWAQALEVDVSKLVQDGDNELVALAWNEGGRPPRGCGLIAERDGAPASCVCLATEAGPPNDSRSTPIVRRGLLRASIARAFRPRTSSARSEWRRGELLAFGSPAIVAQEHALPAEDLVLLPGFRAELLYSVPKAQEGSWVSLCEDPAGRFLHERPVRRHVPHHGRCDGG